RTSPARRTAEARAAAGSSLVRSYQTLNFDAAFRNRRAGDHHVEITEKPENYRALKRLLRHPHCRRGPDLGQRAVDEIHLRGGDGNDYVGAFAERTAHHHRIAERVELFAR